MDKNKYKETASAIEEYVCGQLAGKYLQAAQDIPEIVYVSSFTIYVLLKNCIISDINMICF